MTDTSAAPNESIEERQARLGDTVKADEAPKFTSLSDFITFCLDGTANGTGAPRTAFEMHVATEPIEPGSVEEIEVIHIAPRGFAYLAQRFNINTQDGNGLIANDLIEAKKQYMVNAKRAEAAAALEAAQSQQVEGVASVRIGGGQ